MAQPDDRAYAAAQAFLLTVKAFWTTELYPALREEYAKRVSVTSPPHAADDVERLLADSTLYQYFGWLERHLQRFKYSGRYGVHHWIARDREQHKKMLDDAPAAPLALDPALPMPRYYASVDIHQHPGGVWSDPIAGLVYERGARSTTPLAAGRHRDLHARFTSVLLAAADASATKTASPRVLDMGCGFGKSALPIARAMPHARIEAIDLAAPCLQVGARDAHSGGLNNVSFLQVDARATSFSNASFDVVTSTMLLHELPPNEIERTIAEAARLLKPGGRMVHLDFLPHVQPSAHGTAAHFAHFARFIHYGHARRNNEPFMRPLAELDLVRMLEAQGFTDICIEPFEEADGTLAPDYRAWRFPWTVVSAARRA